jgi:hypothetical protein
MTTTIKPEYTDVVHEISSLLFQALWEQEPDLDKKVRELDSIVNNLLRRIGFLVGSLLLAELASVVTKKAKATGLTIHRCKRVKYLSLFGAIEIPSPYLWDKNTGKGARPVKDQLKIEHGDRSVAVQRALTDFGAEESFGQAAKRFQEHYGWAIDRATVRREVEKTALKAQKYVEIQLFKARLRSSKPLTTRPDIEQLLVELDGCHIRTGISMPIERAEVTKKRQLLKRKRESDWREVRVGLARPLQNKEKRTYVARMSKYPEVVQQLVSAAFDQGMSKQTHILAVADGGNGLREALEAQFPILTFILDRPHLKQHLYEGAEAIGLTAEERHKWVSDKLHLIDSGGVRQVIRTLKKYRGQGRERITTLSEYLNRFSDAVDYDYFRAIGLPIGSGEVESAHRYIPQKRLKIPGATWHPDTINPMLALRIIRANGWWEDFWTKQTAQVKVS